MAPSDARQRRDAIRGGPPRRADARRNYEALLASARTVFAEQGVDAPLDDVARHAGVGNATMYRHFPTRQDLIVAVYADEVNALTTHGDDLLGDASPGDALFSWLHTFVAHVATKRALALAISDDHPGRRSALFDDWHQAIRSTADALLRRAQRSGAIRTELTTPDLLALANGLALAGPDADQIDRLLDIIRRGAQAARG